MSTMIDFGHEDTDGPDRDGDGWFEEEDVLIAEVTHACCGKVQSYWNCSEADVPSPEVICRNCQPRVRRSPRLWKKAKRQGVIARKQRAGR